MLKILMFPNPHLNRNILQCSFFCIVNVISETVTFFPQYILPYFTFVIKKFQKYTIHRYI